MTDEQRDALTKLGPERVKHLLAQGTMVHHLMVPAYEFLDEIDAKERAPASPIEGILG